MQQEELLLHEALHRDDVLQQALSWISACSVPRLHQEGRWHDGHDGRVQRQHQQQEGQQQQQEELLHELHRCQEWPSSAVSCDVLTFQRLVLEMVQQRMATVQALTAAPSHQV